MAAAHGVSRRRTYCVPSLPSRVAMPRAPMWSGMRAPELSPRKTMGRPRLVATRFMWPILRPLVAADEAPITVKSLATTAQSRPSIRPKPATLPSAGERSGSAGEAPNRPDSMNVPGSSRRSTRSRTFSTPWALRRASFSGPPIASARARLVSYWSVLMSPRCLPW